MGGDDLPGDTVEHDQGELAVGFRGGGRGTRVGRITAGRGGDHRGHRGRGAAGGAHVPAAHECHRRDPNDKARWDSHTR